MAKLANFKENRKFFRMSGVQLEASVDQIALI